jgi:hypothetical protein
MDTEKRYFLVDFEDKQPKYSLNPTDFKLLARAIELAYLTKGNSATMSWILMGETGMPDILLVGFVSGAIDIYNNKAFITRQPSFDLLD